MNGARISAIQRGRKFTWKHTRAEILKSLTDITLTARFLALSRLKRKSGSTAKVWIYQVLTRRALLEDPKLPSPILLPETLYLELTVGQMSHQETTLFECPCIGDDLNARDRNGQPRFTLERLRAVVDACSNPPQIRGVKTPITELLDQEATEIRKTRTTNANSIPEQAKRPTSQKIRLRPLLLSAPITNYPAPSLPI